MEREREREETGKNGETETAKETKRKSQRRRDRATERQSDRNRDRPRETEERLAKGIWELIGHILRLALFSVSEFVA